MQLPKLYHPHLLSTNLQRGGGGCFAEDLPTAQVFPNYPGNTLLTPPEEKKKGKQDDVSVVFVLVQSYFSLRKHIFNCIEVSYGHRTYN